MPAEHPEGFAGSSSEFLDLVTHYTTVIRSKIDTEILVTMTIGIWNLESSPGQNAAKWMDDVSDLNQMS